MVPARDREHSHRVASDRVSNARVLKITVPMDNRADPDSSGRTSGDEDSRDGTAVAVLDAPVVARPEGLVALVVDTAEWTWNRWSVWTTHECHCEARCWLCRP